MGRNQVSWACTEEPLILKILLAGAFLPNLFVRSNRGGDVSEESAVKTLLGRDPYSSVYLTNYDERYPGYMFTHAVKELLKNCAPNMKVSFENSSKVYVEFPKEEEITAGEDMPYKLELPGRVSLSVYKAIKLRQLGVKLPLKLPFGRAYERSALAVQSIGSDSRVTEFCPGTPWSSNGDGPLTMPSAEASSAFSAPKLKSLIPPLDICHLEVHVSHVCNAGRFWIQDAKSEVQRQLAYIFLHLNRGAPDNFAPLSEIPKVGHILIAPYLNDLFRARVTSIKYDTPDDIFVSVLFIDYGNTDTVHISELLEFGPALLSNEVNTLPAIAIDCRLAEVAPSTLCSPKGHWCEEANQHVKESILEKKLYCQVYSVVNSVMSVRLMIQSSGPNTINNELLELGFAQPTEESFLSQTNHKARQDAFNMSWELKQFHESRQQRQSGEDLETDVLPLPADPQASKVIYLKGPFSPLEMKLQHLLYCSKSKEVTVEGVSVNSVMLDDNPQDKFDRLIVAGCVQTTSRGSLILRQTTILPNLPGLPALICLIFSPVVELRANEDLTKLTGIICGLGCDEKSKEPYFDDHDIELAFDTNLDLEDIEKVNKLRNLMNTALCLEQGQGFSRRSSEEIRSYQLKIRQCLSELLRKQRKWQEPVPNMNDQVWGLIPESNLVDPGLGKGESDIFQPIWGIKFEEEGAKEKRDIADNLKNLEEMATNVDQPMYNARCLLCKLDMCSASELRLHLTDPAHLALNKNSCLERLIEISD